MRMNDKQIATLNTHYMAEINLSHMISYMHPNMEVFDSNELVKNVQSNEHKLGFMSQGENS